MPTCRLTNRLGDVQHRVQAVGQEGCVVLNDTGILLGYLGGDAFAAAPQTTADQVMEPGPSTIRPHVPLEETVPYMQEGVSIGSWLPPPLDSGWISCIARTLSGGSAR
jgi:hypothetical protein